MIWIKKVATVPLDAIAKVIDSIKEQENDTQNAPSIHAVREALNIKWADIYPIGSIYMNVNDVDPSYLFGGTWQKIEGKFLLSSGNGYSVGTTGGEATHTLAMDEMPKHAHNVIEGNASIDLGGSLANIALNPTPINYQAGSTSCNSFTDMSSTLDVTGVTDEVGGDQPHNNMPPYLVVNVWKRTA